MGSIGVVSFVPGQTDNHSKLDGDAESKSEQKKDGLRRRNAVLVGSDWRQDGHGIGEGDAGASARLTNASEPGSRPF